MLNDDYFLIFTESSNSEPLAYFFGRHRNNARVAPDFSIPANNDNVAQVRMCNDLAVKQKTEMCWDVRLHTD